jgi:hypothetical protein
MASLTLAEAGVINQNPMVSGVIESIVTTNPIYRVMPFQFIDGNAMSYNRELSLGDVAIIGAGSGSSANAITAKAATKFVSATAKLVPIVGDAEIDHFEMVTMSGDNDQEAVQIAGKAKSCGRKYQDKMINGDEGSTPLEFDGLAQLIPAGQKTAADQPFSFELLDELMDKIKSKDGLVDWFQMSSVNVRRYLTLLRAQGGAGIGETMQLPGGGAIMAYRGVPIFQNDYITETAGAASIFCGVWDDGSKKIGLSGIGATKQNGIFVTDVGEKEDSNEVIKRVRFYCGLALYSELGAAVAEDVVAPA